MLHEKTIVKGAWHINQECVGNKREGEVAKD